MVAIGTAIFDLDGVLTSTAQAHARAWKETFDGLFARGAVTTGDLSPFSIEEDYLRSVDGLPREDGIRSFLAFRGITLEEGSPDDPEDAPTVTGVAKRKDQLFQAILQREGVQVYDDAVRQARAWKERGWPLAVATSSRNGRLVCERAGLDQLFEVIVDGQDLVAGGMSGKPQPDMFWEAARRLGVRPDEAVVLEDAESGITAARRGGFGLAVAVDRTGHHGERFKQLGAHCVLTHVDDFDGKCNPESHGTPIETLPGALDHFDELVRRFGERRPALFLDYDGTLTPIVKNPAEANLGARERRALETLAGEFPVAVVSGRERADVERRVGIEGLYYAGSHGFDMKGPELQWEHEGGVEALPQLEAAHESLTAQLQDIEGLIIERKRFAIAVHFRNVTDPEAEKRIRDGVDQVIREQNQLRSRGGKKIFELQPDVDWNKGRAVHHLFALMEKRLGPHIPVFLGDDLTDEDAFRELHGEQGLGIVIGEGDRRSLADYRLAGIKEVFEFLKRLRTIREDEP